MSADGDAVGIYGQKPQPEETPEFVSRMHALLEEEMEKLPDDLKAGWLRAKEKCPDLVGEEHRLMFLRCEVFNADLAAQRIGKYWNKRIELFGETRSFKPLHIGGDGALSSVHSSDHGKTDAEDASMVENTLKGLHIGFIRPTETHDSGGRAILFADPSRLAGYNKKIEAERMGVARALWYVMHHLLEGNATVQRIGMVAVAYPHHAKLSVVDRKLMKINMESMTGCIPIRMGGFHVVHPPWFFGSVVFPIMKLIMPARMRKRVKVHSGSDEKVLESLKEYGLSREVLPTEIGGDVIIDTDAWLHDLKSRGM